MQFSFTEEQQLIRDTAAQFVDETVTSEHVRRVMQTELGYCPEFWGRVTGELYWQALPIEEDLGGMGLGFVELVATLEQMGRRLTCSPYFATVCLALYAVKLASNPHLSAQFQTAILEGQTASLIHTGADGGFHLDNVDCQVTTSVDQSRINGTASHVLNGNSAEWLVVCAKELSGMSLFLLPVNTDGISIKVQPSMDQTRRLAEVTFDNVAVSDEHRLCSSVEGEKILENVLDLARIAAAAEMVGGAQQALDMSVEYIKERVQFGRTIASFQAVKHKCADVMLKVESARSALYWAACMADELLAGRCEEDAFIEAVSTANCYASEAFFFAAGTGIQLHGGVGITSEYDIQLYFKRARAMESYLGNPAWQRERMATILLGSGL
jgi:alkylation response protein AidB-like acyl-CoA dehydrogenase